MEQVCKTVGDIQKDFDEKLQSIAQSYGKYKCKDLVRAVEKHFMELGDNLLDPDERFACYQTAMKLIDIIDFLEEKNLNY